MEKILCRKDDLNFGISDEFSGRYLVPIIENVLYKADNQWDDYDEVYHCCKLVEEVKADTKMKMDFHFIQKNNKNVGIALVTSGAINYDLFFNDHSFIQKIDNKSLIFNYFHISSEGRGNGEKWLRDVILDYYKSLNFKTMYVKSSHPKVFSLYERLGVEIGEYITHSDNGIYERKGKIFSIVLN